MKSASLECLDGKTKELRKIKYFYPQNKLLIMRTIHFLSAAMLMGAVACNNAGDKTATDSTKTATDTTTKAADTMAMAKTDSSQTLLPVPAGAKVFFKNLKNGETVKSPVKVEMGVDGMKLDTAGALVAGTGHHHLLIDAGDSIPTGTVVPKDSTHLHFGKAQSTAEVKLTPGTHVLTLQFADGIHRSYGSQMASTITVKVK
jgi:hypothetical protein